VLTPRQEHIVKLAARWRAADEDAFNAFLTDATAGRTLTDRELKRLIDEAVALTRRSSRRNGA
jgi:hypothetical protein